MPKPKTDAKIGELTVELTEPERKSMARVADMLSQISFLLKTVKQAKAASVIRETLRGDMDDPEEVDEN